MDDLAGAAQQVSQALNALLNHIKHRGQLDDDAVDAIFNATDKLFNSMGDAPEMVRRSLPCTLAVLNVVPVILLAEPRISSITFGYNSCLTYHGVSFSLD